jgi:hypothetical protein
MPSLRRIFPRRISSHLVDQEQCSHSHKKRRVPTTTQIDVLFRPPQLALLLSLLAVRQRLEALGYELNFCCQCQAMEEYGINGEQEKEKRRTIVSPPSPAPFPLPTCIIAECFPLFFTHYLKKCKKAKQIQKRTTHVFVCLLRWVDGGASSSPTFSTYFPTSPPHFFATFSTQFPTSPPRVFVAETKGSRYNLPAQFFFTGWFLVFAKRCVTGM